MTFEEDRNRPLNRPPLADSELNPYVDNRPNPYVENERSTGMVWGTLAVLAILIVGPFMYYNSGSQGPQTASNNTPSATQTTPTPAPAPAPAPDATPKQ